MNNKTAIALAAVVVILVGGALIYRSADKDSMKDDMTSVSPSTSVTESPTDSASPIVSVSVGVGAVKEFVVTGSNFAFAPSAMTVNKGDKVRIIFKNSGGTHDFKIDEFAVATARISGGQSETVEFTADKAGSFEYYCSVGNHRAMGMKGTLTVK